MAFRQEQIDQWVRDHGKNYSSIFLEGWLYAKNIETGLMYKCEKPWAWKPISTWPSNDPIGAEFSLDELAAAQALIAELQRG